ncbi:RelE family toxin-antitoxin system [Klebsiella pneumoniae]|uniref:RelE family toxin-antitoxin system n=1 Tax=Klebsiella pneumoniae TaxID=573 RepID=A0A378CEA3_KLEPN|nr:RelE family toxin-antitoxin system [Klebsiella pneumoniae]
MTDITELAQRLKLEVHRAVSDFNPQMNIKTRDLKELVEALASEKRICATWRKTAESTGEKLEKAQETIAFQQGEIKALLSSLESRTVKLPDEVDVLLNHLEDVLPFEVFQLIDAHKWNAVSRLSAAGIKVEQLS